MGYRGWQDVTRRYRGLLGLQGLQGFTRGYNGLQRVARDTGAYKELPGVTRGFKGLQRVTGGCKSLQGVKRGYRGLQGCTICEYLGLSSPPPMFVLSSIHSRCYVDWIHMFARASMVCVLMVKSVRYYILATRTVIWRSDAYGLKRFDCSETAGISAS